MQFRRIRLCLRGGHMAGIAFGPDRPPDLVFLHATGFNARTYAPLLAPLGAQFAIVALDQRGHGLSTLPADPAKLDSWDIYVADAVEALAQLRGAGPAPVLCGHSMGGAVALMAGARAPASARALVLLDPVLAPFAFALAARLPGGPHRMRRVIPIAAGALRRRASFPSEEAVLAAYRGRGAFKAWPEEFLQSYVADGFAAAPDGGVTLRCTPAWEAATFSGQRHFAAGALSRVKVRTLILRAEVGSTMRITPHAARRRKQDLEIETVTGGTHFFPMEDRGLVRSRLITALERSG
jgi:pimeloyl-ACP methyl ester carboxylesterase